MPIEHIFGDAPRSHLPFSPAVKAGPFVYVSGQASVDDTGKIVPGTFEEEFRRSIANIERVLAQAGLTLKDVVKVMSYVDSSENLAEYNRLYREVFPEPFPARTTVVNCLTGVGIKYEVDVVAYKD
ncbi:RidA family protein [Planctomicrobium sp. SH527]|uniref:RidA family protein n=1 Tax=Planctomicrobium sp. SH527 TaxID=3448123 RepID=UPI003F5BE013